MDKPKAMKLAGALALKDDAKVSARMKTAAARRYFRELAESWDLWYELYYHNDPPGMTRRRYEELTRLEASRVREWLPPGGAFLDLGCGDGRILELVAPRCGRAHGVDLSAKALAHARRRCARLSGVRLHLVDGPSLPFENGELDLALCHLMLSHLDVEPVVATLREVRRVLKTGGRLVFDLPNLLHEDHLAYILSPDKTNWPGINRPRFWTAEGARALLEPLGFLVEEMVPGRFIETRAKKI